jgi:hypothetical protein
VGNGVVAFGVIWSHLVALRREKKELEEVQQDCAVLGAEEEKKSGQGEKLGVIEKYCNIYLLMVFLLGMNDP